MFNIDKKYITIGIKEQIGIYIQLFMWNPSIAREEEIKNLILVLLIKIRG